MSDLTPSHPRIYDGRACLIDWEQARYASLYLDLPNHFTSATAPLYREALERHGFRIAPDEFATTFHEVGRYMGLRYLEVGLVHCRMGGAAWQAQQAFFNFCLDLALNGR